MIKVYLVFLSICVCFQLFSQSASLPTDRSRVMISVIPDVTDGTKTLKVLRTDANTPLRGASPWIADKNTQPNDTAISVTFFKRQADQNLNSIRIVWFEAWHETYNRVNGTPLGIDRLTDFNNPVEVQHLLNVLEAAINNASVNGMYACINYHNAWKGPVNPVHAAAFWNVVAPYFKNRTHVIYEVANEPTEGSGSFTVAADRGTDMSTQVLLYNICKTEAPNTMRIMFSPPSVEDTETNTPFIAGIERFESLITGGVDWTTTAVGYHTYYLGWDNSCNCFATSSIPIRVLHRRYPGIPTEITFPEGVLSAAWNKGPSLDGEKFQVQTLERLGVGWWLWAVTNPDYSGEGWFSNWPFVKRDALDKGYYWWKDGATGPNPSATALALSPKTIVLNRPGNIAQINASITPANAINEFVKWSTNDSTVATVDNRGRVTAIGAGGVYIKVVTEDGGISDSCFVTVSSSDVDATIAATSAIMQLDGVKDAAYGISNIIGKTTIGAPLAEADLSGSWSSTWDSEAFYFHVSVKDDAVGIGAPNRWDNDGIEIYIDGKNTKSAGYTTSDFSLAYVRNSSVFIDGGRNVNFTALSFVKIDNAEGYDLEVRIPFASLNIPKPVNGSFLGLDVHIVDNDNGTNRKGKKAWFTTVDNSWQSPANFGTASLTSNVGIINVTGVAVNPPSIDLDKIGKQQQLAAVVSPANASNKNVTWSSSNLAVASVSASGQVRAQGQGTALITVTTTDGGFTASATINVTSNAVDAEISKSAVPITIDAIKDAAYTGVVYNISNPSSGVVDNVADLSGQWTAKWRDDALYFYVNVVDDILGVSAANRWENDGVEIYIDAKNDKAANYGATDFSLAYVRNATSILDAGRGGSPSGIEFVKLDNATGYTLEVKIPYTTLGISAPLDGHLMGLDVHLIDNDGGNSRQGKMAWFNTVDDSWTSPSVFSTIRLISGTVLPVQLIKFGATADNRIVLLSWQTTAEFDLAGFVIEHKGENGNFVTIGNVNANNQFGNIQSYKFAHNSPLSGSNFYRLKITDKDGTFRYSPIASIKFTETSGLITAYPNPVKGNWLNINLGKPASKPLFYSIFNVSGKLIHQGQLIEQVQKINIEKLPGGIYNIQISNGQVIKFIKM